MTRRPLGKSEHTYNDRCRHSRNCGGKGARRHSSSNYIGGGRAALNRAMRRDNKALVKEIVNDLLGLPCTDGPRILYQSA